MGQHPAASPLWSIVWPSDVGRIKRFAAPAMLHLGARTDAGTLSLRSSVRPVRLIVATRWTRIVGWVQFAELPGRCVSQANRSKTRAFSSGLTTSGRNPPQWRGLLHPPYSCCESSEAGFWHEQTRLYTASP